MKQEELKRFVDTMHKQSIHKPRLRKSEYVVIPTPDCPLPDQPDDMTDIEWIMLCHIVHSPLIKLARD